MDVISWLGAYFVKNEVYEKAMQFFERAAQIQPNEVPDPNLPPPGRLPLPGALGLRG